MKQSIIDHLKAQRICQGQFRLNHPRQWQEYKLSNISTISFLSALQYEQKTTEELVRRLPLLLRDNIDARKICIAKIKQLKRLGLMEYDLESSTWKLTDEGLTVLVDGSSILPEPKTDDQKAFHAFLMTATELLLVETTTLFRFNTHQQVLADFLSSDSTRDHIWSRNYISMSCAVREILEDVCENQGYDRIPFQAGATAASVKLCLESMNHIFERIG